MDYRGNTSFGPRSKSYHNFTDWTVATLGGRPLHPTEPMTNVSTSDELVIHFPETTYGLSSVGETVLLLTGNCSDDGGPDTRFSIDATTNASYSNETWSLPLSQLGLCPGTQYTVSLQ